MFRCTCEIPNLIKNCWNIFEGKTCSMDDQPITPSILCSTYTDCAKHIYSMLSFKFSFQLHLFLTSFSAVSVFSSYFFPASLSTSILSPSVASDFSASSTHSSTSDSSGKSPGHSASDFKTRHISL